MRALALSTGVLLLTSGPAVAQAGGEATLSIKRGGKEIGREEVILQRGSAAGPTGSTLTVASQYSAPGAPLTLDVSLERDADGELEKFALVGETADGQTRVLAVGSGARLIIKTAAQGSETGREVPGGPGAVVLDENVFGLYAAVADLATPEGVRLAAFFPRTGRRARITARRSDGTVEITGDISGTLTLDSEGRILRMVFPADDIIVTRLAE